MILNEILKYLENIESSKINNRLKEMKNNYNDASKKLHYLIRHNPKLFYNYINGGGKSGEIFENVDDMRINFDKNIRTVIEFFKSQKDLKDNSDKNIKEEYEKFTEKLEELRFTIESLKGITDNVDETKKFKYPADFSNTVKSLTALINDFNDKIQLKIVDDRIMIPITKFGEDFKNVDYVNGIISKISKILNITFDNVDGVSKVNLEEIKTFREEVIKKNDILKDDLKKLLTLITHLEEKEKEIETFLDYKYNENEIVKEKSIYDFNEFIKSTPPTNTSIVYKDLFKIIEFYKNKTIKESKFIDQYNALNNNKAILDYKTNNKFPITIFNGIYTERIYNNKFTSIELKNKLKFTNEVFNSNNINYLNNIKLEDIDNIINPTLVGGAGNENMSLQNIKDDLSKYSVEISDNHRLYLNATSKAKKLIRDYNIFQSKVICYMIFLSNIITDTVFFDNKVYYIMINRGILSFYKRILENIVNKIMSNDKSTAISYFRKYHYITVIKLYKFIDTLISKMTTFEIIKINKCSGETLNRFNLLNNFKHILEKYNETFQSSVSIYLRINDKDPILYENFPLNKMFFSDYERFQYESQRKSLTFMTKKYPIWGKDRAGEDKIDHRILHVNNCSCMDSCTKENKLSKFDESPIRFTEVFDTTQYKTIGDISNYMTLSTTLSKGEGIIASTFGYSGTGKSYTVFGDGNNEGILQSVLNSITGMESLEFRIFEIYGFGIPLTKYWVENNGNNIIHNIYRYYLSISNSNFVPDRVEEVYSNEFEDFVSNKNKDTYINVQSSIVQELFKNFSDFTEEVDILRKGSGGKNGYGAKRISETPNNPVSSRSIVVYDFLIGLGNKKVPFVIIDMPGKERITKSYVDTYMENKTIKNLLETGYVNLTKNNNKDSLNSFIEKCGFLLDCISTSPITVPIIDGTGVLDYFKSNMNKFKELYEKEIVMEFEYRERDSNIKNKFIASDYNFDKTTNKFNKILDKSTGTFRGFKMKEEMINLYGNNMDLILDVDETISVKNSLKFISEPKQSRAVVGVSLINRLIETKDISTLISLLEYIVNRNFNKYLFSAIDSEKNLPELLNNLKNDNFKTTSISNILNGDKTKITPDSIKEIIKFDFFSTIFEGYYINEIISGLTKEIAVEKIPDEFKKKIFIKNLKTRFVQDDSMTYEKQLRNARIWNSTCLPNESNKSLIKDFYGITSSEDIYCLYRGESGGDYFEREKDFDTKDMSKMRQILKNSYQPSYLFSFDNTVIGKFFKHYLSTIKKYTLLYLVANYNDKIIKNLKCIPQLELLESAEEFIKTIEDTT